MQMKARECIREKTVLLMYVSEGGRMTVVTRIVNSSAHTAVYNTDRTNNTL